MVTCTACGVRNPEGAHFCHACGAALPATAPAPAAIRKTVTVLFCDVVDSTARGERVDPEALRRVMSRYFDEMRAAVEAHEGTVEKFIGDAVMAVFGVPAVHEDDALRAVRSADEMRRRLADLNRELEGVWGVQLQIRIGINTGEVVAGDPSESSTIVTGDVVNTAKRLQEAAEPGSVLIGHDTYGLVAGAVRVTEPNGGALRLKGKSEPFAAWQLHEVDPSAAGIRRRLDGPFVGRRSELGLLVDALARVEGERTCRLFTVLGAPGLGKSRLARELAAQAEPRATFLTGHCLAYGEGITFWPLGEIVREAGGEQALREALEGTADAQVVLERVRGALGEPGSHAAGEETFWAVRKLFEALARTRPLVVCFEDIHWAEPTLLDLIEYLAGWIRDAPVLLVCTSRRELVDRRPGWLAPRAHAGAVALEPLSDAESEALLRAVGEGVSEEARARIAEAAEGNPLFVEQMAAMAAEAGEGAPLAVPPTIQALLAARLDRLEPEERAVIERAAVVGRGFWRSAVHDLAPPELRDSVGHQLMALVRKELILPDTAKFEREDAFRFRHVLIRDVAYDGMPKQLRADLHERFSDWLDEHERERAVEFEEIRGYHLEQAYRLREQLGPVDERTRSLAERAAYVLGAAGRRAFARDDAPAAVSLLDRALALATEQDPARLELQRELSYALWAVGEVARAESLLNGLLEAAAAAGDRRQEWYAILDRSARRHTAGGETADELLRVAEEAVEIFRGLDDHVGLARAWRRVSLAHRMCNRYEIAGEAAEKAIRHAREAGDAQEEARAVDILCTSLLFGPTHAETAIERCHEVLAGARRTPLLEANVASSLAGLEAMVGDVDAARARCLDAAAIFEELGLRMTLAGLSQIAGMVELLAGDGVGAEEWLRRGLEILGSGASSGLHYSLLAHSLYEQGRHDEAEEVARAARAVALPGETHQQVLWRTATARLAILHADEERGEALARGAVRLTDDTDALNLRADALVVLAEVLDALELDEDAAAARADATELYRRKGNVAALALFERSRRRIVDGSAARARRERR